MLYKKLNCVNDKRMLKVRRRNILYEVVYESFYEEVVFELRIKLLGVSIYVEF